jgi:hypothetical protein
MNLGKPIAIKIKGVELYNSVARAMSPFVCGPLWILVYDSLYDSLANGLLAFLRMEDLDD